MSLLFKNRKKRWVAGHCLPGCKLTKQTVFIIAFFIVGAISPFSMNAQNVTLYVKNQKIVNILDDIKTQTQYDYFYNKSIGLDNITVTVTVKNVPLQEALNQLFQTLPYAYKIANKTIVINPKSYPKKTSAVTLFSTAQTSAVPPGRVITGKIINEFSKPVEHALIMDYQTQEYVYSGKTGEFTLPVQARGSLIFSGENYITQQVEYEESDKDFTVKMIDNLGVLDSVKVETLSQKKDPTRTIDLSNRRYMNLGQVLQGTIPGLTLQISSSTKKQVTGVKVFQHYEPGTTNNVDNYVTLSVDDFLSQYGQQQGNTIINTLLQNPNAYTTAGFPKYILVTSTVFSSTLLPQLRGSNTFSGSTSRMLIVIDGFPQDNFPADYPMSDVESVEVIKDPKELIKWGPAASGGIVYIKTRNAKSGSLKFNYNSTYYYQPAPRYSESKLMLSNSSDYLNYVKNYFDSANGKFLYYTKSLNLSPAIRLLANHANKLVTDDQFNTSWDSLKSTDNESQLTMLQRNTFSQNHILSISGGNLNYRFILIGAYSNFKTNSLNDYNKTGSIKLNNQFNLLNSNLRIDWLLNYNNNDKTSNGYSFDPNNTIEPYQLLKDASGNYIYDYSTFSQDANRLIESYGYKNYGVNVLQDAKLNTVSAISNQLQSNLRMSWTLPANFKWTTSILYSGRNTLGTTLYDKQSSYVRQLVDKYGAIENNSVNFYLPYGHIINKNRQKSSVINVRSDLSWSKVLGNHKIAASIGGGGSSVIARRPSSSTMYGYNADTKTGTPIFLPAQNTNASITNFYKLFPFYTSTVYPRSLLNVVGGDSTTLRSLNWNASLRYTCQDRLFVDASYNNSLNPVYGQAATFSVLSFYNAEATGQLIKNKSRGRFFSGLFASVGLDGTKMPDLPLGYSNFRYLQSDWNNYTIWVNGVSPTQQKGQITHRIYEKVTANLFDSSFLLNVGYNILKTKGSTEVLSGNASNSGRDTAYLQHYFSAGLQVNLRKGNFQLNADYDKSPEGRSQFNGAFNYNIAKESYFHSNTITTLFLNGVWQDISAYQALGLMMSTNVASGGSFSSAVVNSFSTLPPSNLNKEIHATVGLHKDDYLLDLRYYSRRTSNLDNSVSSYSDPATGLASQITYSTITNRGIEFLLKTKVVKNKKFNYTITVNGAYNQNIATGVPYTAFTATGNYPTAYRTGFSTSNIWSFKWAGLNEGGEPQVYGTNGKITSVLDSASLAGAMVYSGTTMAPWTGGFIHELNYKQFFARVAFTFNFDYVMRSYMPSMDAINERSVLVTKRWQKPGDEKHTDVAKISNGTGGGTYRAFVLQNSSNTILPADNVRLQEIMLGWTPPVEFLKSRLGINSITITLSAQNPVVWTKNKYHIDPSVIASNGRIGLPVATQYIFNLNIGF